MKTKRLGETERRPIMNVQPNEDCVYHVLKQLVLHPERIDTLKRESIAYIERHHDYVNIARRYIEIYEQIHD